jgi:hypothetical protein
MYNKKLGKKIIKNIGETKTFIYNGVDKKPMKNDIKWTVNYDNDKGVDLNLNMNNNGDKSHYHQFLTNLELEELLKIPVVDKSLHQRLLEDFNPYNSTNMELLTYPVENSQQMQYPYMMRNDFINNDLYSQLPLILQGQQQQQQQPQPQPQLQLQQESLKNKPNIIKIKIYTRKHKNKNKKRTSSRIRSIQSNRSRRSVTNSKLSSRSNTNSNSH